MKMKLALSTVATCLIASSAFAGPVSLTNAQMDSVAAGGVETVAGFVCPVITTAAVLNSPKGIMINGAYSIKGPLVTVPIRATNDDGAGRPFNTDYASPGDSNYTAIWGFQPS